MENKLLKLCKNSYQKRLKMKNLILKASEPFWKELGKEVLKQTIVSGMKSAAKHFGKWTAESVTNKINGDEENNEE